MLRSESGCKRYLHEENLCFCQDSQEVTSPTEETPPVVMETVQVEVQKEEPEPPKEEVLDSWEDVEEKLEEEKPETHMETGIYLLNEGLQFVFSYTCTQIATC